VITKLHRDDELRSIAWVQFIEEKVRQISELKVQL
jgi:hypothetical protein